MLYTNTNMITYIPVTIIIMITYVIFSIYHIIF